MVKTIVHHLGLGDQIMLNGMVRHFAETDNVAIFVKRCHEESVRFMYRDIADKVELILVDNTNAPEIWSKVKGDVIPLATYGIDDNGWKFMTQGQGSVMTNWAHIFEYLGVIENADEVHCMNSSYNWMIELMNIGNPKKNFFHLDVAHKYYGPRTVKTVFSDEVWTFI